MASLKIQRNFFAIGEAVRGFTCDFGKILYPDLGMTQRPNMVRCDNMFVKICMCVFVFKYNDIEKAPF
jgi:hypothetical protein